MFPAQQVKTGRRRALSDEKVWEADRLHNGGFGLQPKDIADRFGVSVDVIHKALGRRGVYSKVKRKG